MDNTKRALAEEATEKEIPRAAYEGVLTLMWMHRWKAWKSRKMPDGTNC